MLRDAVFFVMLGVGVVGLLSLFDGRPVWASAFLALASWLLLLWAYVVPKPKASDEEGRRAE